jgi:type IX secretion system substrate protein
MKQVSIARLKNYAFSFSLSLFFMLSGVARLSAQVATSDDATPNVLPSLLMSFTGEVNGSAGQLNWVAENQTDIKWFVVEKSTDGNNFDSTGIVTGLNNAYSTEYQYMDTHLFSGSNYYRLRQLNMDGSISYSKVISIDNSASVAAKMDLYPNPAVSMINYTITTSSSDQVIFQVFNLAGMLVTSGSQQLAAGVNQQSIAIAELKSGSYFLKVSNKQGTLRYVQAFAKI